MDGKRSPNNWSFYFKSNGYLCFDLSDRNDIEELDRLKIVIQLLNTLLLQLVKDLLVLKEIDICLL